MSRSAPSLGSVALVLALLLWGGLAVLEAVAQPRGTIPFSYKRAPLAQIIRDVARATGRTYVFDDSVRGEVTVGLDRRVSEAEAVELLNAVLQMRDYAAVPGPAGAWKIVPLVQSSSEAPFSPGGFDTPGEGVSATLVTLQHLDAADALRSLSELSSNEDVIVAYGATNSIILSGTEVRLQRFVELLRALDAGGEEELWVRTIRYRDPEMLLGVIDGAFQGDVRQPEAWIDERTNSVVLLGDPEALARVRPLIDRVDRPVMGLGDVQVVRVFNRDVEEMAQLIESLRQGDGAGAAGRPGSDEGDQAAGSLAGHDYVVIPEPATSSLLIRSDAETFQTIAALLARLDRAPARVAIDITFFEVSTPRTLSLGVNAFVPVVEPADLTDPLVFLSSGDPFARRDDLFASITRAPLSIPIVGPGGEQFNVEIPSITSSVVARETRVRAEVLQRPHLVVVGGEEHRIFVGDNIPIPVAAGGQPTGSANVTRQTIERQDVGIEVVVRPTVGEGDVVGLEIDLEFTGLIGSGAQVNVGPTLTQRRLQARLHLRAGDVAVLGAGREQRTSETVAGTPFLMDIPFLGRLFRVETSRTDELRLLVAVEARILRTKAEQVAASIRRRLGFERERARVEGLEVPPDAPWALRVDTRRRESDARAVAEGIALEGRQTQIGRWRSSGGPLYDVVVTGFATLAEAGEAARSLGAAGWQTELVSLRR